MRCKNESIRIAKPNIADVFEELPYFIECMCSHRKQIHHTLSKKRWKIATKTMDKIIQIAEIVVCMLLLLLLCRLFWFFCVCTEKCKKAEIYYCELNNKKKRHKTSHFQLHGVEIVFFAFNCNTFMLSKYRIVPIIALIEILSQALRFYRSRADWQRHRNYNNFNYNCKNQQHVSL